MRPCIEEVRVVDVELHGVEEVLHPGGLCDVAVDEVLVPAADDDLPGDDDLVAVLVSHGGAGPIGVVEGN